MNIGKETKEFNIWVKAKYTWVDFSVKKMLFKAWCARASKKRGK